MQNIFRHLTYLLTKFNCVIIPEFGGFVLHTENATYSEVDHVFMPPSVSVGFNPELKYNDGLLTESLMKKENLNYQTALQQVEEFSGEIRRQLNNTGEVIFPKIGKITFSDDGALDFIQASDSLVNSSMYGLSGIYLNPVSQLDKSTGQNKYKKIGKEDDFSFSLGKKFLKITVTAAAAILVFLFMSTPIMDTGIPSQYASIISTPSHISPEQQPVRTNELIIHSPPVITDNEPEVVKEKEVTAPIQISPEKTEIIKVESERIYYIVVASFNSSEEDNAQVVLDDFKTLYFPHASVLKKDNHIRVYVNKFKNKNEAENYLSEFRKDYPEYGSAWIFSSR